MILLGRLLVPAGIGAAALALVGAAWLACGDSIFSPGQLNAAARAQTPLGGAHSHSELAQNCAACHAAPWSGTSMAERCQNCHFDIRRQIAARLPLHGNLANVENCRACHSEHNGPLGPLTNFAGFDHDCAAFKLTGRHAALACAKCHVNDQYRGTARSCAGCHAEPAAHRGKFGLECAQCHDTNSWKTGLLRPEMYVGFDHDRTDFRLTGAHRLVACTKCHVNQVFKGTAHSCAGCHADPPVHRGRFGLDCAKCHSTTTWRGTYLVHAFPLNHGGGPKHVVKSCTICHAALDDFKSYTCSGCHRHDPHKTAEKHLKRGIVDFQDCFACHPTGRKRKAEPPKHPLPPGQVLPPSMVERGFPPVEEAVRQRLEAALNAPPQHTAAVPHDSPWPLYSASSTP